MRLLLDMNIPPSWVDDLCAAGHQASHWRDVGDPTASDATILGHSRRAGLVLLTRDLDFGDILAATGGAAPSVVQLRTGGLGFAAIGQLVLRALTAHAQALDRGALITVDLRRSRVRLLPLLRLD